MPKIAPLFWAKEEWGTTKMMDAGDIIGQCLARFQ